MFRFVRVFETLFCCVRQQSHYQFQHQLKPKVSTKNFFTLAYPPIYAMLNTFTFESPVGI